MQYLIIPTTAIAITTNTIANIFYWGSCLFKFTMYVTYCMCFWRKSDLILNPWEIHSTWQYKNPFQQDCDRKGPYRYLLQVFGEILHLFHHKLWILDSNRFKNVPLNAVRTIRVQKSKIELWLLKKVHSILIESMTLNPTKGPDIFGIEDSKQIRINDFRFSGFDWLLEGL